jgi:hypothetical protein
MNAKDHILNVRVLLHVRTYLRDIPRWWAEHVEAKIARIDESSCWFWVGALNHRGEPTVKLKVDGKYRPSELKRIVAKMFWDLKPHWEVHHACGNTNCLNPRHFYVTALAHNQHNRKDILYELRRNIRRWGATK